MKTYILFILLMFSIHTYAQQDSLRIYFQGLSMGETYKIYYKSKKIGTISVKRHNIYLAIPLDYSMKENHFLDISIYRKGWFSLFFRDTYFATTYNPNKKYLIVHRNQKLKRRFAIEPIWRDELIRYRQIIVYGRVPFISAPARNAVQRS